MHLSAPVTLATVRSRAVVLLLLMLTLSVYVHSSFCKHLDGEERAGYFTLFVLLVSRDCCVALPHDATGLSAVCDCGVS